MKLTIEKTITEEIEIEFPFFKRSICLYYYAKSENECMCVTLGSAVQPSVDSYNYTPGNMLNPKFKESTEKEFREAYNQAINSFNHLLNH